jgi:hypothetical protein
LENDRGRDVRHDAQAEDRDIAQAAGTERGHGFQHIADAAALIAQTLDFRMIEDWNLDLKANAVDGEHQERQADLGAQLGNLPNDGDFFPHGVYPSLAVSVMKTRANVTLLRELLVDSCDPVRQLTTIHQQLPKSSCSNDDGTAPPRAPITSFSFRKAFA